MKIIDSHTHMPSVGWTKRDDFFASVPEAVNYLRTLGIDRAVFTPWRGVLSETREDLEQANCEALELVDLTKGFLYPGVSMNPEYPDESIRGLQEFHAQGYRWAGELLTYHLKTPCKYTDAPFVFLVEQCEAMGFIVQLHVEQAIVDLAEKFPGLKIVCSHIGDNEFLKRLAQYEHTWLDISGMAGGLHMGRLEAAVDIFTTDRLLFGSDFTGYDPQAFIARVKTVVPDIAEQKKVFSENILALLDSAGSRPMF